MKMLIGIYCNNPKNQILAALAMREHLHLLAYDLQQPAIDATAVILGVSAHEIAKFPERYTQHQTWNQSSKQIQTGINKVLLAGNQSALIDNAKNWLNTSRCSTLSSIFNGHLIHGITTEREAEFIRDNGGTMIHIVSSYQHCHIAVLPKDVATYCVGDESPSAISLLTIANAYRNRIAEQKEAA